MNNLTKEKIALAVTAAIKEEDLMNKEAAVHFGISACYLSMIKQEYQYESCPAKAWEAMRNWMYSGKKIKEYMPSAGVLEVSEEKNEEPPTKEVIPLIKIRPGILEARKKEIKEKKKKEKKAKPSFTVIGPDNPEYLSRIARASEESPVPETTEVVKVIIHNKDKKFLTPDLVQKIILEVEVHLSIKQ